MKRCVLFWPWSVSNVIQMCELLKEDVSATDAAVEINGLTKGIFNKRP